MRGLTSNFGIALWATAAVTGATIVWAAVTGYRSTRHNQLWLPSVARALTVGAALACITATALPREFGFSGDGDLVLVPGRGGLGDLDQILADPFSLAGVLLYSNVLLYMPIGFFGVLGFHARRGSVLIGCLALSLGIETIQFLALGRVATIDDVILNMAGAALGFLVATGLVATSSAIRVRVDERPPDGAV